MIIKASLDIDDFRAMELLENCCYNKNYITNSEEVIKWYKAYPNTTVAAYSEDELAGFINYFPVRKDIFDALKAGKFSDSKLTVDDIVDVNSEGPFYMFFCSIAVAPFFQERGLATELVRQAVAQYRDIEEKCVEVLSDNVTVDGEIMSKRLGLDFLLNTEYGTKVYWAKYENFLKTIR